MNGFTLQGWENFFVASSGASASLAGLLFVALSINLQKIIATPGLTERAGETFVPLGVNLILSMLALVPGEGMRTFAVKMVVFGGAAWIAATTLDLRAVLRRQYLKGGHLLVRIGISQPSTLAIVLAGLSILLGFPGGLYWLVPAILFSLAGAMLNAWVLLVEILR
jgi:hypothetical protein